AVTGFDASDISVSNGTAGAFTAVDSDTYTLAVTPTADGTVTVAVAADAARDALGNCSEVASAAVNVKPTVRAADIDDGTNLAIGNVLPGRQHSVIRRIRLDFTTLLAGVSDGQVVRATNGRLIMGSVTLSLTRVQGGVFMLRAVYSNNGDG